MTKLGAALGVPVPVTIGGSVWQLTPLDVFDMVQLSGEIAKHAPLAAGEEGIDKIDLANADHLLTISWMVLRKADPTLTPQERDDCAYRMTRADVRRLFALSDNVMDDFNAVLKASGIKGDLDEASSSKNVQEPPQSGSVKPLRKRSSSSVSGVDILD